jgi:hypothetical protein
MPPKVIKAAIRRPAPGVGTVIKCVLNIILEKSS